MLQPQEQRSKAAVPLKEQHTGAPTRILNHESPSQDERVQARQGKDGRMSGVYSAFGRKHFESGSSAVSASAAILR